jgi:hypothetical protein
MMQTKMHESHRQIVNTVWQFHCLKGARQYASMDNDIRKDIPQTVRMIAMRGVPNAFNISSEFSDSYLLPAAAP